jgi:hypothetical protein
VGSGRKARRVPVEPLGIFADLVNARRWLKSEAVDEFWF